VKINTVSVGYERKFNLGNWESVVISGHMWASVDEEEDPDQVMAFCFEQTKQHVKANIPPGYKPFAPTVTSKKTVSGMEVE
jgi:hypothetical protein